ncbi:BMP family ABC transporter substrate-binding protein [Mesorhizobium sp. BAC0120]|uniref:BMP family lipoprotein n=1 Tax=Mesorhizobium sp. BAC0120 TaxID=3090670 RepID=UPI00298BF054|nr:BMP family ABC transporter substrate-binding protein [Mesorhizobium sp. BAC0120]MDW6021424.1 BMP family ABC transporter substrate-binding protein [Mesorhizobium sp. BAC0120]
MRSALLAASAAAILAALSTSVAFADPGLLYDLGGKFDRSFNENAFSGAERFKQETGVNFLEFELSNDAQREQALRTFAQNGVNPIAVVGFSWAPALEKVAKEFPDAHFAIVDATVDLPNVQSIEFKYGEGAFVVGALAGLKTKTGTVGFVGGMDVPIIKDFACAFHHGAAYTKPGVRYIENMTGPTPSAWNDPTRGRELALGQYDRGADIIFAAAGGTTVGILQAAADADKLAIGVGLNQNSLHPGHVLTSATAEVGLGIYLTFKEAQDGTWRPGVKQLGLAEKGVGWSLDENNKPLLTDDEIAKVDGIVADIIAGKIQVPSYIQTGACPAP